MDRASTETQKPFDSPASPGQNALSSISPGLILGLEVAGVAGFGNFVLFSIAKEVRSDGPFTLFFFWWFITSMGLLSIWLGIGQGKLYLRVIAVLVVAAALAFMFNPFRWEMAPFADITLFLVAVSAPFGLLFLTGFRLIPPASAQPAADPDGVVRGQVSLRQLFGWTVAAAIVASIGRFAELHSDDFLGSILFGAAFSSLNGAIVLAALMAGSAIDVVARLAGIGMATPLIAIVVVAIIAKRHIDCGAILWTAAEALAYVATLSFVLLLYRRLGYRYRRIGAGGRMNVDQQANSANSQAVA